jgi:hypothetical protein
VKGRHVCVVTVRKRRPCKTGWRGSGVRTCLPPHPSSRCSRATGDGRRRPADPAVPSRAASCRRRLQSSSMRFARKWPGAVSTWTSAPVWSRHSRYAARGRRARPPVEMRARSNLQRPLDRLDLPGRLGAIRGVDARDPQVRRPLPLRWRAAFCTVRHAVLTAASCCALAACVHLDAVGQGCRAGS